MKALFFDQWSKCKPAQTHIFKKAVPDKNHLRKDHASG